MKKLYSVVYVFFIVWPLFTMEKLPLFPADLEKHIFHSCVNNVHNKVATLEEARKYLVPVSLINKEYYNFVNNLHVIKNIIHNLSAVLSFEQDSYLYESHIASKLKISGSKNYYFKSNQLFSQHLDKDAVQQLLNEGADPNYCRTMKGRMHNPQKYDYSRHCYANSPLIFYISGKTENDYEIVQLLLENGADVNRIYGNYRPLEIAIRLHLPKIVELLLAYKPSIVTNIFSNDLEYAIQYGNSEIIKLLQNYSNMNCNLGLRCAINEKNTALLQDLFNHGANPDRAAGDILDRTIGYATLPSTEMLRVVCNNGISKYLLSQMFARAKAAKGRIEEVFSILDGFVGSDESREDTPAFMSSYEYSDESSDDVLDFIPDLLP